MLLVLLLLLSFKIMFYIVVGSWQAQSGDAGTSSRFAWTPLSRAVSTLQSERYGVSRKLTHLRGVEVDAVIY